jgi:hypothetical protein
MNERRAWSDDVSLFLADWRGANGIPRVCVDLAAGCTLTDRGWSGRIAALGCRKSFGRNHAAEAQIANGTRKLSSAQSRPTSETDWTENSNWFPANRAGQSQHGNYRGRAGDSTFSIHTVHGAKCSFLSKFFQGQPHAATKFAGSVTMAQ